MSSGLRSYSGNFFGVSIADRDCAQNFYEGQSLEVGDIISIQAETDGEYIDIGAFDYFADGERQGYNPGTLLLYMKAGAIISTALGQSAQFPYRWNYTKSEIALACPTGVAIGADGSFAGDEPIGTISYISTVNAQAGFTSRRFVVTLTQFQCALSLGLRAGDRIKIGNFTLPESLSFKEVLPGTPTQSYLILNGANNDLTLLEALGQAAQVGDTWSFVAIRSVSPSLSPSFTRTPTTQPLFSAPTAAPSIFPTPDTVGDLRLVCESGRITGSVSASNDFATMEIPLPTCEDNGTTVDCSTLGNLHVTNGNETIDLTTSTGATVVLNVVWGTQIVRFDATDGDGVATCIVRVTVLDNYAPILTCPPNPTTAVGYDGATRVKVSWDTSLLTVTDNVGLQSPKAKLLNYEDDLW